MADARLSRAERIKHQADIRYLFRHHQSISAPLLRAVFTPAQFLPESIPVKVAFSVPKRQFPKAHDRNTIKRNLREAYRLNKSIVWTPLQSTRQQWLLMWIFTGKEIATFHQLHPKIILILNRLKAIIEEG